jgi:tetratricopeptide (TPR) repeat protein
MSNHPKRWLFLFAAIFFFSEAIHAFASPINDPTLTEAISEGDSAYKKFDNNTALANYRRAVEIDSSNYEALWKLARAYVDAGMRLPRKEQPQYYALGEKIARRCAMLHPDSSNGHFLLAVSLGRRALYEGGKRKIQLAKEVKVEAERALQAYPQHDGAMHALGRWNYELADLNFLERAAAKIIFGGLPTGASYEQAARYFEAAISRRPNAPSHHYELARTLLKLNHVAEARRHLEQCIALPDIFWDDAQYKLAARQLQDKLQKS